ncbi:MAG: hypothetical protein RR313_01795 [Anaerovoracaceae bacterium]
MKTINFFKKYNFSILSLILFLLAVALGADSAMAIADTSGAIADDKGINSQLPGTAATSTQIREGDLAEDEVDEYVDKYMPFKFPLYTDIRSKAKRVPVKGMEISHYASGTSTLDGETTAAITNATKDAAVLLPVKSDTMKQLAKDGTLFFPNVQCYDENGVADGAGLLLIIVSKTATTISVSAVNGPLNAEDMYVPDIPAASKFLICGNALSETQMQVEPENYQPRKKKVYLQKQGVNIVISDDWKNIIKKLKFIDQEIKDDALYKFKRKKARTQYVGRASRRKVYQGGTMGDEYVYTSEGILRQINMLYGIGDVITFADLIRLTKMQFTDYSVNKEVDAYCGKNFIEKLLNIDFTRHKEVDFVANTVLGVDIKAFKTTFGTTNFKYDPTLDDIGYEDFCVIADIANGSLYVKDNGSDYTIDMKEGAGENRMARRDVHIETDCIALKGYNSILVGPSGKLAGMANKTAVTAFTTSATIPTTNLTNDMLVLLTAAAGGFNAGDLIQYKTSTSTWVEYVGELKAV